MYPPVVCVSDPDAVKQVFTSAPEVFPAGASAGFLVPLLGTHSPLVIDGAPHERVRRSVLPAFSDDRLRTATPRISAIANAAIDKWPLRSPFALHARLQAITLEVALATVFGDDTSAIGALRRLLTRLTTIFSSALAVSILWGLRVDFGRLTPWRETTSLLRDLDVALYDVIVRRRPRAAADTGDVLSLLVADRDGEPLSPQQIRDAVLTILVAAQETTASSLTWVIYHLLRDPDSWQKVLLEGEGDPSQHTGGEGELFDFRDLVIKESLRLTPAIPNVGRTLARPTRIGSWLLPPGVIVAPCAYLTHRRGDLWAVPDAFRPDRFRTQRPGPFDYYPFGGGMHRCLGAALAVRQMKIVLTQIVARTQLRLPPEYSAEIVRHHMTLAPSAGLPVILDRRVP
jgi:cytochrome P450